jgi:hypothetical protein
VLIDDLRGVEAQLLDAPRDGGFGHAERDRGLGLRLAGGPTARKGILTNRPGLCIILLGIVCAGVAESPGGS